MLVVTANWCVPDGTLSSGPPRTLVARLRAEVRRASLRAGVRPDGSYRPVQAASIVFAGDTFDWLTSREWTGDVRPWESSRRAAAARERVAIASLRQGSRLVGTLMAWARRGFAVPDADRRGRPLPGSFRHVPLRIALLRGDRDRWIDRMVAPDAGHAVVSVGTDWTDGIVTVRHGEEIESLWHPGGREPTLGESLAVDLIAQFAILLIDGAGRRPWWPAVVRRLVVGRIIDAPVRLAGWLAARERDGSLVAAERSAAVAAWNQALAGWHRAVRRLDLGDARGIDVADRVAASLALPADAGDAFGVDATMEHFDPDAPTPPAAGTAASEILGHPPAGFMPPAVWRRRVLCIGPGALQDAVGQRAERRPAGAAGLALFDPPGMIPRIAGVEDTPLPSAALVGTGATGPWLDWLPLDGGAAVPDCRHGASDRRGIWRSNQSAPGLRIVDAA